MLRGKSFSKVSTIIPFPRKKQELFQEIEDSRVRLYGETVNYVRHHVHIPVFIFN